MKPVNGMKKACIKSGLSSTSTSFQAQQEDGNAANLAQDLPCGDGGSYGGGGNDADRGIGNTSGDGGGCGSNGNGADSGSGDTSGDGGSIGDDDGASYDYESSVNVYVKCYHLYIKSQLHEEEYLT